MQDLINKLTEGWKAERSLTQLTLGDAIQKLEDAPCVLIKFDTGSNPLSADSYRGYYSDLAISEGESDVSTKELYITLSNAINRTFFGYKGGDFFMDKSTPLWMAEYGDCGRKVMDIIVDNGKAIILTEEDDEF